ncbi:hypothetical protein D3C80_1835390 [compost metagenome]
MNIDKLSEAIASGTLGMPPGLSHEERLAFVTKRLNELGFEEPIRPLRKYDPEACMRLLQSYIDEQASVREAIKNA